MRDGWAYHDANGRPLIGPCSDLECNYQSLPGGEDHAGLHSWQDGTTGWPHDYGQYCECPECVPVEHEAHWQRGPIAGCPPCDHNVAEDKRITDKLRDEYPGFLYDGRDGSIEAEDDDEERIAAEDAAREEAWAEFLDWQRSLGARC